MANWENMPDGYPGLTEEQARQALQEHGRNEESQPQRSAWLRRLRSVLREPMFLLLGGTALIYFVLREWMDGAIMLFFVAFMAGISLLQEWRTDRTLEALRDLSAPRVRVVRGGVERMIGAAELAVGDKMLLSEGDRVAADGDILACHDLGINESALSGEPEIIWKCTADEGEASHWRRDRVYTGSMVVQGRGAVRVTATGGRTAFGRIREAVAAAPDRPTPIERQIRVLVRVCVVVALVLLVLAAALTWRTADGDTAARLTTSILAGITLAMATLPEEFPVILAVFLALGAARMARANALIRRMPSVETLGAVSVLCVDKTGTLTENRMRCEAALPADGLDEVALLRLAVLASETDAYDPMEQALLDRGRAAGVDVQALHAHELLGEFAFQSETRRMGHLWGLHRGPLLAVKGAPESVLGLCRLSDEERAVLQDRQGELAAKGFRVLAVAWAEGEAAHAKELQPDTMRFAGLLAFADPPRAAVPEALAQCLRAGIRIVMITGDNPTTARSIADRVGLPAGDTISGDELEAMSDEELAARLGSVNIFARVLPAHKMRIVTALKARGEVVAMTGDGVNDAPALKYADIGIAMGSRGAEVAREAADMVLLDDNFGTIVGSVRDGRRIYDNIRKAIGYVLVVHIPIAFAALLCPLLGLPALLMPVHVVLLELLIDPTCSILFERLPAEPDVMERPPRSPREPLMSRGLLAQSLLQGGVALLAVMLPYALLLGAGVDADQARSFALVVLVLCNLLSVLVNRSQRQSLLHGALDPAVGLTAAAVALALAALLYVPAVGTVAFTAPLTPGLLALAVGVAGAGTLWWEVVKWVRRRTNS